MDRLFPVPAGMHRAARSRANMSSCKLWKNQRFDVIWRLRCVSGGFVDACDDGYWAGSALVWGSIMFKQVGAFVTMITAPAGPGLSTYDGGDWLVERGSHKQVGAEEQGPQPDGDGHPAAFARDTASVAASVGSRMKSG
jgi:hypothetical protein